MSFEHSKNAESLCQRSGWAHDNHYITADSGHSQPFVEPDQFRGAKPDAKVTHRRRWSSNRNRQAVCVCYFIEKSPKFFDLGLELELGTIRQS